MPSFSKASKEKLSTCVQELQDLFNEVIRDVDCIILCGNRSAVDQEKAFDEGNSKLHFPQSKHNSMPSRAVDVAPYHAEPPHIRWNEIDDFRRLSEIVKQKADDLDIDVKWGGDWKSFKDYPHYEV